MGIFSRFEGRVEDTFEGAADKLSNSPISPVQIAKKAEKEMRRNKMVGAGRQYAPTLYTVLVNADDDRRLFGYYPTLAGETETYLSAKASEQGFLMDGQPLVRFIVDDDLKRGKFQVIAELVSAPIVSQLREEEMQRYGMAGVASQHSRAAAPYGSGYDDGYAHAPQDDFHFNDDFGGQDLPYVPEDEIDYSIDYGEYTFNSQDFQNGGQHAAQGAYAAPDTTVFAAGPAAGARVPDRQAVHAHLVDLNANRTYDLASARQIIGRSSDSDIVVRDLNASRTHAELRFEPQGIWVISDLGSTNGTRVNDVPVSSQALQPGDRITIGTTVYEFDIS